VSEILCPHERISRGAISYLATRRHETLEAEDQTSTGGRHRRYVTEEEMFQ
jgi:hypothetical protein